jgi:enterochelin esterase-like enzyme
VTVSLLHGFVPFALSALGLFALGWLLAASGRRWWLRRLPIAAAVAAVATVALVLVVEQLWRPFPDALPPAVVALVAVSLLAVAVAALRWPMVHGWQRWVLVPTCAVSVLVSCMSAVNVYYGQYPTPRALFGTGLPGQVDLAQVNGPAELVSAPPGLPLAAVWQAPPGMPPQGAVSTVDIPSTTSGFPARKALVYLPPAYLTNPRARLPVLVMLEGQPGSPRDWFEGGGLAARMDRFAAVHAGLAPVVVVPDVLGAPLANPLCLDSRLGNAATYLDVDVPTWIRATLHIDPRPSSWAVGGYSSGGTCALQAAVRSPRVYPTLLDISGQDGPTLGSTQDTAQAAFGGDEAALRSVDPLSQLRSASLPESAAMIVVGDHDGVYLPQQRRVADGLQQAGVPVEFVVLRGGHSWAVWGSAVDRAMPWLARRLALT